MKGPAPIAEWYQVLQHTVDSQKIVYSKFCEFTENRFLRFLTLRTWSASYTLQVAALIIANFNFASEAIRKKRKKLSYVIFFEFTVVLAIIHNCFPLYSFWI